MNNFIKYEHERYPQLVGFHMTETFDKKNCYESDELANIAGVIAASQHYNGNILFEPSKLKQLHMQLFTYRFEHAWQVISLKRLLNRNQKHSPIMVDGIQKLLVDKIANEEITKISKEKISNLGIELFSELFLYLTLNIQDTATLSDEWKIITIDYNKRRLLSTTYHEHTNDTWNRVENDVCECVNNWQDGDKQETIIKACFAL